MCICAVVVIVGREKCLNRGARSSVHGGRRRSDRLGNFSARASMNGRQGGAAVTVSHGGAVSVVTGRMDKMLLLIQDD